MVVKDVSTICYLLVNIQKFAFSAVNWLKPPTKKKQSVLKILIPSWMSWKYFVNNWSYVLFVFLFGIALNFFLFIEAAVRHRQSGKFMFYNSCSPIVLGFM